MYVVYHEFSAISPFSCLQPFGDQKLSKNSIYKEFEKLFIQLVAKLKSRFFFSFKASILCSVVLRRIWSLGYKDFDLFWNQNQTCISRRRLVSQDQSTKYVFIFIFSLCIAESLHPKNDKKSLLWAHIFSSRSKSIWVFKKNSNFTMLSDLKGVVQKKCTKSWTEKPVFRMNFFQSTFPKYSFISKISAKSGYFAFHTDLY